MSKVVLYIAASLDGYIAGPDGGIGFLDLLPNPEGTDHGYQAFLSTLGTVIMGRATYEKILTFGIEWPYGHLQTWVVSNQSGLELPTPNTRLVGSGFPDLVRTIRDQEEQDIWLVGGGKLLASFLDHDLVDRMMLFLAPLTLGKGIPLFQDADRSDHWKLTGSEVFSTGIVGLTYDRLPATQPG